MKVILLAGGFGTRLSEYTKTIPKPMVDIAGKPMLLHIMKQYAKYGFKDFYIALGYKGEIIKKFFNKKFFDWNINLIETGKNTMTGGRLKRLEPFLCKERFMLTYGDGVADININKLVEFHKSHRKTITFTGVHPSGRFGEFVEHENKVITFSEKPDRGKAYINGGFMVFNKELLDYLTEDENCDLEIGPLVKLTKKGEVMVYKHTGSWECMDHERDLTHLNNLWNNNQAFWKMWN